MTATILYLDFDGVLHRDAVYRQPGRGIYIRGGELFEWGHFLEELVRPFPDLRIVLSTSWVRELGYDRARSYLPPMLAERVIGATFHRRIHGPTRELRWHWAQMPRGQQIAEDVSRRRPRAWFAIDDATDEFTPEQSAFLVHCQSESGLSDPAVRAEFSAMLQRVWRDARPFASGGDVE